jgi:hypothetical protein
VSLTELLKKENLEMFQAPFPIRREKLKKEVVEVAPELVATIRMRVNYFFSSFCVISSIKNTRS